MKKPVSKRTKIFTQLFGLAVVAALMVSLAGCKMSDKETQKKIQKQNEQFEWKVDPVGHDLMKPKN